VPVALCSSLGGGTATFVSRMKERSVKSASEYSANFVGVAPKTFP